MILRVQNFLMIALFALFSLFWAQSFVSQNPISGGYQFFEEGASANFVDNSLKALEKFTHSPKTAPDFANAPKGGVKGLDQLPDGMASPSTARVELDSYIKGTDPNRPVSVATAEVTVNGETQRFVSVSSSWKADAPNTVVIDGKTYTVIRTDSGSVSPDINNPNANHAEQKLFSHIQEKYSGQNAQVNIAVENTSASNPGMCTGCTNTSQNFAGNNPNFNINIYEGSTGANK